MGPKQSRRNHCVNSQRLDLLTLDFCCRDPHLLLECQDKVPGIRDQRGWPVIARPGAPRPLSFGMTRGLYSTVAAPVITRATAQSRSRLTQAVLRKLSPTFSYTTTAITPV